MIVIFTQILFTFIFIYTNYKIIRHINNYLTKINLELENNILFIELERAIHEEDVIKDKINKLTNRINDIKQQKGETSDRDLLLAELYEKEEKFRWELLDYENIIQTKQEYLNENKLLINTLNIIIHPSKTLKEKDDKILELTQELSKIKSISKID